ncbi:MAG: DUF1800 family protein [Alphaproteobacteria bacterium]
MSTAAIAAHRFGLGARPGDLGQIGGDPRGWVAAQITHPTTVGRGDLPATEEAARLTAEVRAARGDPDALRAGRAMLRELYWREGRARIRRAVESDAPFATRMVEFWANHFTVSALRPSIHGLAGAFAREAIAPHVFGRFEDLLLAATRHPAMLLYLDNAVSIGPGSRAGRRTGRGLNENHARELLELHTVGVGHYGQHDIRQLALVLTGWTLARPVDSEPGQFRFAPAMHEPGGKTVLGRTIEEGGEGEGLEVLRALARHPATARHVATKLARHFAADRPPPALVDRLARRFLARDGDLAAVARELVTAPEPWSAPLAKVKTPFELVVSAERLCAPDRTPNAALMEMSFLGQVPFTAPSPQGWPDTAEGWIGPESVLRRIEWASGFAGGLGHRRDALALAREALGPLALAGTIDAIRRAPSAADALALMLASAEFQRR